MALLVALGGLPASAGAVDEASWPGFLGDTGHTSHLARTLTDPAHFQERWTRTTSRAVRSIVTSDGRVFVTADNAPLDTGPMLTVFDPVAGTIHWTWMPPAGRLSSAMVIFDGHVVVGGTAGTYLLDSASHQGVKLSDHHGVLAYLDDLLLIGGDDGVVTAIALPSIPSWRPPTPARSRSIDARGRPFRSAPRPGRLRAFDGIVSWTDSRTDGHGFRRSKSAGDPRPRKSGTSFRSEPVVTR